MKRRDFLKIFGIASLPVFGSALLFDESFAAKMDRVNRLDLKITDVKTFLVNRQQSDENFVFVQIYTNKGLVGLGEGTLAGKAKSVEAAILEYGRFLMGKNPANIEMHWQGMYRAPRYRGGPILMSAISALEIALWDILGQALEQPIWQLLGGKVRERVRFYPHFNQSFDQNDPYKTPKAEPFNRDIFYDAERYAKLWANRKADGWTASKGPYLKFFDQRMRPAETTKAVRQGLRNLEAVRKAVGEDFDVLVELHGRATPPMAVEFCNGAEAFFPMFVEEATQIEDLGELQHLREHTSVPLATGERLFTKYIFSDICERHLVDYVQPDIVHAGGILELKKIGAIAEANRIQMAPHNPQSLVCTMASLHINVCTPNATILEVGRESFEFQSLFKGEKLVFQKGYALPPNSPGLGIQLNEKQAKLYPYKPKKLHSPRLYDGSWHDR
ncbi:MAG: enolase C-terminal domain-like protein [candidate division KSB1 bacterium]|nr:enolase C-terminal domain-like protein [candidate division KSB1 bacterium]